MAVAPQDLGEPKLTNAGDLRPRQYQEEIFRQAQAGNRIAALDTGSGKTYIGLMLIKWIASQPQNKDKLIVFLVPRVARVEQQGNFIAANSSLRVTQKHGQNALDMADREGWAAVFATSDVLVMTGACGGLVAGGCEADSWRSPSLPRPPHPLALEHRAHVAHCLRRVPPRAEERSV